MPTNLTSDRSSLIDRYCQYEEGRAPPAQFVDDGSLDAWRVAYSRKMILPFLRTVRGSSWLTVGDGYYGSDANFLSKHGVQATASSLSAKVLRVAQQRGWINKWSAENAESLSFADCAFDFVLCMEALQHCEFPEAALSETMRVSNQGIAIMGCIRREGRILDRIREFMRRRLLGRQNIGVESYQPTGGPISRFYSEQVCENAKRAGFSVCAIKQFNMLPLGQFWNRRAAWLSPYFLLLKAGFFVSDLVCRLGLMTPSFAWFLVLRRPPSSAQLSVLTKSGFSLRTL